MCLFLINVANSIGVEHWMWRWWLPSTNISSLSSLHVSGGFHGVLFLGVGGQLGHLKVPRLLGLLKWLACLYPILGTLFAYLAWTSVVFKSGLLELNPCVRLWLAFDWTFALLHTGPMGFISLVWIPPSHNN